LGFCGIFQKGKNNLSIKKYFYRFRTKIFCWQTGIKSHKKVKQLIIYIIRLHNNIYMAKRSTGVGKKKKSRSHKTAKRLEAKRLMLEARANKKKKK